MNGLSLGLVAYIPRCGKPSLEYVALYLLAHSIYRMFISWLAFMACG